MAAKGYVGSAEITVARPEDVLEMSDRIRQADRAECWQAAHITAEDALWRGMEHSMLCWTGRIDGKIICMFGVAPLSLIAGQGIPWLIGTEDLPRHARTFLVLSSGYVDMMLQRFPHLANYVAADNTVAVRWLDWLGFTLWPAMPFGPERALFHRFSMDRGD